MAYRLGEALDYDPFAEEEHAGKDFSLGDPVDYDPFEEEEEKGFFEKAGEYVTGLFKDSSESKRARKQSRALGMRAGWRWPRPWRMTATT